MKYSKLHKLWGMLRYHIFALKYGLFLLRFQQKFDNVQPLSNLMTDGLDMYPPFFDRIVLQALKKNYAIAEKTDILISLFLLY